MSRPEDVPCARPLDRIIELPPAIYDGLETVLGPDLRFSDSAVFPSLLFYLPGGIRVVFRAAK